MRLTLRTLLAWRDGLLSGKEQEELAARVTEGSVAQGLLDRMEAVEKRHDIEPPKVEGRGLGADANSVAEYLENVLDAENLEAFERICLESDRQLSEVSACHAMLAEATHRRLRGGTPPGPLLKAVASRLASGQPGALPADRSRLVEGIPRQPAAPQRQAERGGVDVTPQIRIASEPTEQAATTGPRRTRRASPWLQVAVAVGLLCLAGGGLGVTLWWNPAASDARDRVAISDPLQPPVEVEQPAVEDIAEASDGAEPPTAAAGAGAATQLPDAELVADSPVLPPVRAGESVDAVAEGTGQAEPFGPAAPVNAESGLPAETVAVVPPVMEAPLGVGPRVPMGDALAIAAPLAPGPEALVPPVPAPEPPLPPVASAGLPRAAPQATPVGVVAEGPMVLVADRDQPGQWRGAFQGDQLSPGVQLLSPSASAPELNLGGVLVSLAPRSQVVLRPTEGEGDTPKVDLEVVFGSATVRRLSGDAAVDVRAGGLQWRLSGPPSAVTLRVALGRQPGADPSERGLVTSSLVALDAEVTWAPLAGSATVDAMPAGGSLGGGRAAVWESVQAHEVRLAAAGVGLEPVTIADRLAVSAAEELAAAAAESGDAIAAARSLLLNRRVEVREVAAVLLALVGDYQPAVALLCDDGAGRRLGERRWRAFEEQVIPLALARGVHSAERLRQAFSAQLPPEEGDRVYRLAVGVSDADLAAGADAELVAALEDSRLVVRRYAALRLEEIVEPLARDRLRYRADAAADARLEGVRWWASQREKGLILRVNGEQLSVPDPG